MIALLLVTFLASAGIPTGPPSSRAAAPDSLGSLGAFGALGPLTSPGSSGKDPFAGFS